MPASAFTLAASRSGTAPSDVCHTHTSAPSRGSRPGSFQAPDHEYPSHLLLTVTVTDSGGLTDTRTVQLDPKTVALTLRELARPAPTSPSTAPTT